LSGLRHPVAVEALFRHCFLLNYRLPAERLRPYIPDRLQLDDHNGNAFVSAVIALVVGLKPRAAPWLTGTDAWHVVYRVPVSYQSSSGQSLPGVFFLRSDTENNSLRFLGNIFTYFRVEPAEVAATGRGGNFSFKLHSLSRDPASIDLRLRVEGEPGSVTEESVFSDAAEAKAFLVERYHAFGVRSTGAPVDIVSISRSEWDIRDVAVDGRVEWLERPPFSAVRDCSFYVHNVPYVWYPAVSDASAARV
jgi:uncharacterized protein